MIILSESKDGHCSVKITEGFRNKDWANHFGPIQLLLVERANQVKSVFVDLSKCRWVDPSPMLSLILSLKAYRAQNIGDIGMKLPPLQTTDEYALRMLKFLWEEGFLLALRDFVCISCGSFILNTAKEWNPDADQLFARLPVVLSYSNTSLIPVTIEKKNSFGESLRATDFVDKIMSGVKSKLSGKMPYYAAESVTFKMAFILTEVVQNVIDHAYGAGDGGLAVYARFRYGLALNSHSPEVVTRLKQALTKESLNTPRLDKEFLENRQGCLELFILDHGCGINDTYFGNKVMSSSAHALENACREIFLLGKRGKRNRSLTKSEKGGLFTLYNLLQVTGDYLHGKSNHEWIGTMCPKPEFGSWAMQDDSSSFDNSSVKGLSWNFRLTWIPQLEKFDPRWQLPDSAPNRNPIFQAYHTTSAEVSQKMKINRFPIVDNRIGNKERKKQLNAQINPTSRKPTGKDCILLFTSKHLYGKHSIWNQIDDTTKFLQQGDNTLFICDLPNHFANVYLDCLINIDIRDSNWLNFFSTIVLVTENMRSCRLERTRRKNNNSEYGEYQTLQYVPHGDDFFEVFGRDSQFDPTNNLLDLTIWIKLYDSHLFWEQIKRTSLRDNVFHRGKIMWGNLEIENYLDFAQTLTDHDCVDIYKRSLQRITGIFSYEYTGGNATKLSNVYFNNIDFLTKRIVDECNSTFFYEPDLNSINKVNVGSVYLTGTSAKEALLELEQSEVKLTVHFFIHPQNIFPVAAMLYWPPSNWIKSNFKLDNSPDYQRIGRTHMIARGGYKSINVPRYNKEGQSYYARNPRQTYDDWQGIRGDLLEVGHFEFEGYHDFIRINVFQALKNAFDSKNSMFDFLFNAFWKALGYERSILSGTLSDLILERYKEDRLEYEKETDHVDLIVYHSSSYSDYAIQLIRALFNTEFFDSKVIPLVPINSSRIGSAMIVSPWALEQITKKLSGDKTTGIKRALIFDTSVISGRTRKELKHLLFNSGAEEVTTICLIDRMRLPHAVPENTRNQAYWRLDIPRLGSSENCVICKGISLVNDFKKDLASEWCIQRVNEWTNSWKTINHFLPHLGNGLKPTPLQKPREYLFSRDNSKDKEAQENQLRRIKITNSFGLLVMVSELHSMTARDDLGLKFSAADKTNSPETNIQLLCAQLILFNREYSTSVQRDMVARLLRECAKEEYPTNATSLAAIILILINRDFLDLEIYQFIKEIADFSRLNLDLRIMIAYHHKHSSGFKLTQSINAAGQLLKYKFDIEHLHYMKDFHLELYSDRGTVHDKGIKRLISNYGVIPRHILLDSAITSCERIKYIIEKTKIDLFRNEEESITTVTISSYLKLAVKSIDQMTKIYEVLRISTDSIEKEWHSLINTTIRDLLLESVCIHRMLFVPLSLTEGVSIQRIFEKMIAKVNNDVLSLNLSVKTSRRSDTLADILRSTHKQNCWMYFDAVIQAEIQYLLGNVTHGFLPFSDPFSIYPADGVANMWIDLTSTQSELICRIANTIRANDSVNEIFQKIQQKARSSYLHITHCGYTIDLDKEQQNSVDYPLFCLKINIPFIF